MSCNDRILAWVALSLAVAIMWNLVVTMLLLRK
jgi:hypothetical protein